MIPLNYPKVIYKYRDWKEPDHQSVLLKNEVFMSKPITFNDPFDCRIPTNFTLLDSSQKIEKYVNGTIDRQKMKLLAQGKNLELEKQKLKNRLRNIEQYQKEYEELQNPLMDKHYGVLSLSCRWDSILMWSHYGAFHKGFCIGFKEKIMRESGLFGTGGPVSYNTEFPVLDPLKSETTMKKAFIQTHNKAEDWRYEEEYRFTKLYFPDEPKESDRIIKVPDSAICEVNMGINISKDHRNEILSVCKKRNIKVFQLKKVPFKFEITREEL